MLLKAAKMVNLMLYIFYHDDKNRKITRTYCKRMTAIAMYITCYHLC